MKMFTDYDRIKYRQQLREMTFSNFRSWWHKQQVMKSFYCFVRTIENGNLFKKLTVKIKLSQKINFWIFSQTTYISLFLYLQLSKSSLSGCIKWFGEKSSESLLRFFAFHISCTEQTVVSFLLSASEGFCWMKSFSTVNVR